MRNENSTHGFNSYLPPTDVTMQNVLSSYDSLYQEENFINNDDIDDDYKQTITMVPVQEKFKKNLVFNRNCI